jgi:hypothetical protein
LLVFKTGCLFFFLMLGLAWIALFLLMFPK